MDEGHAQSVRCADCGEELAASVCLEGCRPGAHGFRLQEPTEWAARAWPDHPCFQVIPTAPER